MELEPVRRRWLRVKRPTPQPTNTRRMTGFEDASNRSTARSAAFREGFSLRHFLTTPCVAATVTIPRPNLPTPTAPQVAGPRRSAGIPYRENYGTIGFGLVNPTSTEMDGRVLTFYLGAACKQYGRDIWVPPRRRLFLFTIGRRSIRPPEACWNQIAPLRTLGKEEHLIRSPEGQPHHSDLVRFEKCANDHDNHDSTRTSTTVASRPTAEKPPAPSRFASWPGSSGIRAGCRRA